MSRPVKMNMEAAVSQAKDAVGALPEAGKLEVFEYLLSAMTPENLGTLSGPGRQQLLAALARYSAPRSAPQTKDATRAPESEVALSFDIFRIEYREEVGRLTVHGKQLDILLSKGAQNKSREYQWRFGMFRGYRMASREENRACVDSLLAKERNKSITPAEADALGAYRNFYVRDAQGGLSLDSDEVVDRGHRVCGDDAPSNNMLYVRDSLLDGCEKTSWRYT